MSEEEYHISRKGDMEGVLSRRIDRGNFLKAAAVAGVSGVVAVALWNATNATPASATSHPSDSVGLFNRNTEWINPATPMG